MTEQRNTVCCGENTERKASEKKTGRRKGFRRLGGILMLFFMLFLAGGTAQAKNVTLRFSGVRSYTYANQALKLVNQARARAGKPKLTMGSRLQEDAMKRAEEIAVYFSHVRPNGESCFSAFTESYARAGENIAAGQSCPAEAVEDWLDSPLHRQNVLDGEYKEIGIGCFRADGVYYWTELFGTESYGGKSKSGTKTVTARVSADPAVLCLRLDARAVGGGMKEGESGKLLVYNRNTGEGWDGRLNLSATAFRWSSSREEAVSVRGGKGRGTVRARRKGTARISASLGSATASATVRVTSHNWKGKVTRKATVFREGEKTYRCRCCGKTTMKRIKKLRPVLKLKTTCLRLAPGRKSGRIPVTVARGDRVVSWKSSNPAVAKVSGKGVVRAGKKCGKAVLTVKLKSGKTGRVTVTVKR